MERTKVSIVEVKDLVIHELVEPTRTLVEALQNGVPVSMLDKVFNEVERALDLARSRTPRQVAYYREILAKREAARAKAEDAAARNCIAEAAAIGAPFNLTIRLYGGDRWAIYRDGVNLATSKNPRESLRRMIAFSRNSQLNKPTLTK